MLGSISGSLSVVVGSLKVVIFILLVGLLVIGLIFITLNVEFPRDSKLDARSKFASLSLHISLSCLRITDSKSFCLDRIELISVIRSLVMSTRVAISAFNPSNCDTDGSVSSLTLLQTSFVDASHEGFTSFGSRFIKLSNFNFRFSSASSLCITSFFDNKST